MTVPLAAGFLFHRVHPMAVWYLNLFLASVQFASVIGLGCLLRKEEKMSSADRVEYSRVLLDEVEDEEEELNLEDVDLESP